jgi:hypothetical protein
MAKLHVVPAEMLETCLSERNAISVGLRSFNKTQRFDTEPRQLCGITVSKTAIIASSDAVHIPVGRECDDVVLTECEAYDVLRSISGMQIQLTIKAIPLVSMQRGEEAVSLL